MISYNDVWNEEQNQLPKSAIRKHLLAGCPVDLILQPGDATRYEVLLVPLLGTANYEISDGGRDPIGRWFEPAPNPALILIIKGGFAEMPALVHSEACLDTLEEQMRIRNPCTTEALRALILEVFL